ncbi:MAG: asparagine synthase (glutamine-hydrolyzing) [Chloroflexi bacterium]|nr:asparagine synthase (glutamine-hydrolyzing) [Chloroflexota bacterium]
MCGIAGIWNQNGEPLDQVALKKFTDALAHRGPDGNGFHIDHESNLGLGHRRLAIIDTSEGGRQPMSFANGRYWITYNGEIYNFLEIKSELAGYGYQFQTDSDTEVVLTAYHHWGEDCQLRFNGMWAFAIWDRDERKLFLSRDRFGVKPLIYYFDNKRFAFASEMKAFLTLDWFHLEFDPSMVSAALTNGGLIEGNENCLLQGLKHLLGGHCLTLKPGERPKTRRWWRTLDHLEKVPERYEDQAARFRELFLDACRIRMRSDVPIGTALSGGLDSSSVICGMRHLRSTNAESDRLANDWQKAFIVTYPGSDVDERKYADVVIKHTGVTPVYCVGNADMYMEYFDDILFHLEEIADVPLGPWLAYKTQRENGIVVTLDGHGADEMLAGYSWYVTAAIKDAIKSVSPIQANELLMTLKGLGVFSGGHILKILTDYSTKQFNRTGHPWLLQKPVNFAPSNYIEDLPLTQNKSALDKSLYIDFHFTQLPTILRNFDRIAMAHGVEIRAPFMDWRLVSYLFSLPANTKIGSGFTKRILRDALKDILPETIRTRTRKLGFPTLAEAWTSPRTLEFIRDVTSSREFQQSTIWNGRKVERAVEAAMRNQDTEQIHRVLIFVQAMSLMKSFREKQHSSLSLENLKLGN